MADTFVKTSTVIPDLALLEKYNLPVPRYTSYPTVPFWKDEPEMKTWEHDFSVNFSKCNSEEGISIYIHLPFCESLCIYCGCNKKVTTNHQVEEVYLEAVLKEWNMYRQKMDQPPVIREIHLGGGTPTFFSPDHLRKLITAILLRSVIHPDPAFSIEGHPGNTKKEHLDMLAGLGFRRISYGVQDLDPEVQREIHRIQPFEQLAGATEMARKAGFTSVNFDLIYGLPLQTPARLHQTIVKSLELQPDRIAFYSYAHTPWVNCAQRLIDTGKLPSPGEKLYLYKLGRTLLEQDGYVAIGMDHFALPQDELSKAWLDKRLHRNFMGYTPRHSGLLLGLGVSAISDSGGSYAQNDKTLGGYYQKINEEKLPLTRYCVLNEEDKAFRRHILNIMCKGGTTFDLEWEPVLQQWTIPVLRRLAADGLVGLDGRGVQVTEAGQLFLRHCSRAFDLRLLRDEYARGDMDVCGNAAVVQPYFSNAI